MSTWESSCRIKKVMQRDRFGCGIACAAMITAKSYSDVRSVFSERGLGARHRPFATNFSELRLCMEHMGINSELKRWSSWEAIDGLGIVAVCTSHGLENRNWHWVVVERHEVFGVVLHDPDFDLPSFSSVTPDGVHSRPFSEYQARKSWIRVSL
ncbi:hypothetical protein ALQ64_00208 [Pseudomonas cannabina]|uniref:Peptidase C39 domain-containing protein n=1 Tax=Pseudomonas cannabina TaxID=86840 RepID=A0A3M3KBB8_PSECA|nr:hypothetical protein [Pseudomonas cannabina]RMN20402.1 hypothetical protein ALQ64_00208 [Pseudomonas cannabina]